MRKLFALLSASCVLGLAPLTAAAASPCTPPLPLSVSLSSSIQQTTASAIFPIHAMLRNGSKNVIPDVKLFVYVLNLSSGDIAARFVASSTLTLLPTSDAQTDFTWQIPAGLPDGSYVVRAVIITPSSTYADIFLRPAESSTSDIPVVISGGKPEARITRSMVNGEMVTATSGVSKISKSGGKIDAVVENATDAPYIGTLTWRVYGPTAKPGDAPIDTKTVPAELHPHTSTTLSYTLSDTSLDGYLVEGDLSSGTENLYIERWVAATSVFRTPNCVPTSAFPLNAKVLLGFGGLALLALFLGAARLLTRKRII